jgi:hypothetical protein
VNAVGFDRIDEFKLSIGINLIVIEVESLAIVLGKVGIAIVLTPQNLDN